MKFVEDLLGILNVGLIWIYDKKDVGIVELEWLRNIINNFNCDKWLKVG